MNLDWIAFKNIPFRTDSMTDIPHKRNNRFFADRKNKIFFPFPCITVAAGGHPNYMAQIIFDHDCSELVEM